MCWSRRFCSKWGRNRKDGEPPVCVFALVWFFFIPSGCVIMYVIVSVGFLNIYCFEGVLHEYKFGGQILAFSS